MFPPSLLVRITGFDIPAVPQQQPPTNSTTSAAGTTTSVLNYNDMKRKFDLCLPIKKHINDIITNPKVVTSPMAGTQILGVAKDGCLTSSPTDEYCKDPRYLGWLANDYHAYPPGTWDFKDINGYNVSPI
jgi:hypothetical protein